MMRHNKFYLFLAALLLALLTACGGAEPTENNTSKEDATVEETQSEEAVFPFTFTDATGEEVTIEEKPERIVSLMPSNTETIFALGLGDEIVGVNDYDNYPAEVEEKEKVGGQEFNVEKVISLEPDLVIGESTMLGVAKESFDQLREAGITVAVTEESNSFEEVYNNIELLSKVTGSVDEGAKIIEEMKSKIEEITEKVSDIPEEEQPTVWFEIDPTLYTGGQGTFMNEMIELLNAKNAVGDMEGWFQFTEEKVVEINPDVIIVTYGYYIDDAEQEVYNREAWKEITAVKEERVYDVESDLVNRPGPRLTEGLEEFAKAIYPDVFAE